MIQIGSFVLIEFLIRVAVVFYSVGTVLDFGTRLGLIPDKVSKKGVSRITLITMIQVETGSWNLKFHRTLTTCWMIFYKVGSSFIIFFFVTILLKFRCQSTFTRAVDFSRRSFASVVSASLSSFTISIE